MPSPAGRALPSQPHRRHFAVWFGINIGGHDSATA